MNSERTKQILYRMFCGFFLGISVIAPGISGSVMAVMMGIYDTLIGIVSNPFKNLKSNIAYLFPMGVGALLSVVGLIKVLEWLFAHYPVPGYLLFMGLTGGSLPMVFREARQSGYKKVYAIGTVAAFAFALTIGMFARFGGSGTAGAFGAVGVGDTVYLSLCGGISGITSMIPGMSVSMVLMMLGVYQPLLQAASNFDILTILPVGAAFVVGMVLFSNLTKYVFRKYRSLGYSLVFGFMLGSLISIFPGLPSGALNWLLSVFMVALGISIALLFQRLGAKFNQDD